MPYFGVLGTKMMVINTFELFWKEMAKNYLFEFQKHTAPSTRAEHQSNWT